MANGAVILECLTGFVGVRSCFEGEPGSGYYINDLPGISSEVLQAITEAEEETYFNTWLNIQKRAILSFRSELLSKLRECYDIKQLDTVECLACENKDLLSTSLWYWLGVATMNQALMNWNNTRYTTVDREAVEEIRNFYQVEYEREIKNAVMGIDVENSACINTERSCLQQNGTYHFRESMM